MQLGGVRLGPDLANYGTRQANAAYVIERLRDPQQSVPGTLMPAYRYLSSQDLEALASYLLSLRASAPLFEGPVTKTPSAPVPSTNAPAPAAAAK